jgi:hypothetical protein
MNANRPAQLDVAKVETTRRVALKLVGGGALLAIAGPGAGRPALARQATPVATPAGSTGLLGSHVVIRIRTMKPDRSADELMALIQEGFVPLVEDVPGFAWYVAGADPETRGQFSVGVFADAASASESTRRAAEWGTLGAADFVEGEPAVYEGPIGVAAEAPAPAGGLVGTYALIRLRQPNPEWPAAEVMARIGEGYVPLVRQIPGFVAYFGSEDPASGDQAYVGLFADKAGADESTRVAGAWLTEHAYDFFVGEPTLVEGIIGAAAEAAGAR